MMGTMENLRLLAGVMFWGLADIFLGLCCLAVIGALILTIVKGLKHD